MLQGFHENGSPCSDMNCALDHTYPITDDMWDDTTKSNYRALVEEQMNKLTDKILEIKEGEQNA